VGILAGFQFGPILLLSAWAGAVADRSDKRRLLLVTQSLEMTQSVGLAVLAFMPRPPLAGLYALAAVGGILLAFDNPLRRSFVSEMVRVEDIPNAVVLYSAIVNLSRLFGPALAGLLVVTVGYGWCFTIDAASYLAVLVCLLLMRPAELNRRPPEPRSRGAVRAGLQYLRSVPVLRISFVMLAAIGTLSYNFSVTLPLFVTGSLHRSEGTFTVLYSIFSLGAVVAALVVAHRGMVRLRHTILGAAALGVTMLLLAAAPDVAVAAPVVFLVGMASILYLTATTAIVQVEARPEMHGRVLSLQSVVLIGTVPVGGPFLGWMADTVGGRAPLVVGGIVSLLAAGFGWWAGGRSAAAGQVDLDHGQRLGRLRLRALADRQGQDPRAGGRGRAEVDLLDAQERSPAGGQAGEGVVGAEVVGGPPVERDLLRGHVHPRQQGVAQVEPARPDL
jgi:MFS family permease